MVSLATKTNELFSPFRAGAKAPSSSFCGSSTQISDLNASIIHHIEYMPFGENYFEMKSTWEAPYKFNGKEKDEETGMYYYGFRYFSPELSIWLSVDPMADERSWVSPYSYCQNNPVMRVDPTGALDGDFISESGKYLGNDGIIDGKVYVVKTKETSFDSGVQSAGISADDSQKTEDFITNNSGNKSAFEKNSIAYDNSVEIEGNSMTRALMMGIIYQDDGFGGRLDNNNREFGGQIDFFGNVAENQAGDVADPATSLGASIVWKITGKNYKSRFHSHPSGTNTDANGDEFGFRQAPSQSDLSNAGNKTNYVFGRKDGRTYIYNNKGVIATMPTSSFVIYQ